MASLADLRKLQNIVEKFQTSLERLNEDPVLQRELEFVSKLRSLLADYGKTLPDAIAVIDPHPQSSVASLKQPRRPRKIKKYRNPMTGETVETKGGNNRLFGEWKARFGRKEVESWLQ
nr:histone-like nucleoid-structuring protein, MvaT/MvaU family [uncultured Pseudomonas sp.]